MCKDLSLTHAVFHHHEAALVTFEALAFKISWRVDTPALSTQVWRDAALVDVYGRKKCNKTQHACMQRKSFGELLVFIRKHREI